MGGKLAKLLTTTNNNNNLNLSSSSSISTKDLEPDSSSSSLRRRTMNNKSSGGQSGGVPSKGDEESSDKNQQKSASDEGGHNHSNTSKSIDSSKKRRKTKDLFLKRSKKVMGGGSGGSKSRGLSIDETGSSSEVPAEGPASLQSPCVCTLYRRTSDEGPSATGETSSSVRAAAGNVNSTAAASSTSTTSVGVSATTVPPTSGSVVPSMFTTSAIIDLSKFNPADYPIDDEDEKARIARAREMEEGISLDDLSIRERDSFPVHSQVDFFHYLVPDLLEITGCSFYWGKIDRYEAERLLEGRPEGTFLLRDSAQEEYLFSVSFRRYGRSLHARIEQWNNHFSFDSHDPSVYSSKTVTGLIGHYKDPSCCMFFEPMLTTPLHRSNVFPLLHLARAAATKHLKYDDINELPLPKAMKNYLKEYHYKQRVCIRRLE